MKILPTIVQLVTFVSYIQPREGKDDYVLGDRCRAFDKQGNCTCCRSGYRGTRCSDCQQCISQFAGEGPCKRDCKTGYYGQWCENKCPKTCEEGSSGQHLCKEVHGVVNCVNGCINKYYGKQCDNMCHENCLNRTCYQNGTCLSCISSHYHGDHCIVPCNQGCISGTCNRTGHCTEGCKFPFYGDRCEFECGSNCFEGKCTSDELYKHNCTHGCNAGYKGTPCLDKCPRHCSECDQQNGTCTVCVDTFIQSSDTGECIKVISVTEKPTPWYIPFSVVSGVVMVVVIGVVFIIWKKRKGMRPNGSRVNGNDDELASLAGNNDDARPSPEEIEEGHGRPNQRNGTRRLTENHSSPVQTGRVRIASEINRPNWTNVMNINGASMECEGVLPSELLDIKLREIKKVFVETRGYEKARQTLKQFGHVTITGSIGEGKTSMALMLGKEYTDKLDMRYQLLMVDDVDSFNIRFLLQPHTCPSFVIFDDIFGSVCLKTHMRRLKTLLQHLELLTKQDNDRKKFVIVFTTRTYNRDEGLPVMGNGTFTKFFVSDCTVDLNKADIKISDQERKLIYEKHKALHTKYPYLIPNDMLSNQIGFPLFCKLQFAFHDGDDDMSTSLSNPLDFLKKELEHLLREGSSRSAALILMVLCEDKLNMVNLEIPSQDKNFESKLEAIKHVAEDVKRKDIALSVKNLIGTFFTKENFIRFSHNCMYDTCAVALAALHTAFVLTYCSLQFLYERVRACPAKSAEDFYITNIIHISSEYYNLLAQRLVEGIKEGHYAQALTHPMMDIGTISETVSESTIAEFSRLRKETNTSERYVQILCWSVRGNNSRLFEHILNNNFHLSDTEICSVIRTCVSCDNYETLDMLRSAYETQFNVDKMEIFLSAAQSETSRASNNLLKFVRDLPQEQISPSLVNIMEIDIPLDVLHLVHLSQLFDSENIFSLLELAALFGHKQAFEYLTKKTDVFSEDALKVHERGNKLIQYACMGGSQFIVDELLRENRIHVDSRGENDWTPIMFAAFNGNKEILDLLLRRGADINLTDYNGNNVLHVACLQQETSTVEPLLQLLDIDSPGEYGWTPVMYAALSDKKEVFDVLVAKGANLKLTGSDGNTILHQACTGGNTDIIRRTMQLYDVNVRGCNSHTPLMMAVGGDHIDVVDLLLSNNADVNLVDNDGDSLLHLACENDSLPMMEKLFRFSDINLTNKLGWTPLMKSAVNGHFRTFQYLKSNGADMTLVDNVGDGVLTLAYRGGCGEIIQKLTSAGEETQNFKKWTKLMYHVVQGHWIVLREYQQNSPELTERDGFGDTLLHLACRSGNTQCVDYLIPCYDIDVRGRYDWTPVMMAARCGHLNVLRCLISHKANLSLPSDTGDVLSLARRGPNTDIVTYLQTLPDFNDAE